MAKKFNVTGEQYFNIDGKILEIKRQLRLSSGSPLNPKDVNYILQKIIEGWFNKEESLVADSSITHLVECGVVIEPSNGKSYLGNATHIFNEIDSNFLRFGLNKEGVATEETLLDVREIVKDANILPIFNSINPNLDKLVMTQNQIIKFCLRHKNLLRQKGFATFFLIKENGIFFVVFVGAHFGLKGPGLEVKVEKLGLNFIRYGASRHRIVFPQF